MRLGSGINRPSVFGDVSIGDVGHDCREEKGCTVRIEVHVTGLHAAVHHCVDQRPKHQTGRKASDPLFAKALSASLDACLKACRGLEGGRQKEKTELDAGHHAGLVKRHADADVRHSRQAWEGHP